MLLALNVCLMMLVLVRSRFYCVINEEAPLFNHYATGARAGDVLVRQLVLGRREQRAPHPVAIV